MMNGIQFQSMRIHGEVTYFRHNVPCTATVCDCNSTEMSLVSSRIVGEIVKWYERVWYDSQLYQIDIELCVHVYVYVYVYAHAYVYVYVNICVYVKYMHMYM